MQHTSMHAQARMQAPTIAVAVFNIVQRHAALNDDVEAIRSVIHFVDILASADLHPDQLMRQRMNCGRACALHLAHVCQHDGNLVVL